MNKLETRLNSLNPLLYGKLNETKEEVKLLLDQYIKNFPDYTDHSIHHTNKVFEIVNDVLTDDEVDNLNADEIYILSVASYLHDIGMCIPEEKIKDIADTEELLKERELHPELSRETYLRNIHHTLSKKFILEEWELLKIYDERYAEAIGLVSEGHRIVDIGNPEIFKPKFTVKSGREFVCLPYLAAVLRIADELDITNIRTPSLLTKYYMPDNEKSVLEWNKHIANTLMFITENFVEFEVKCSNHSMLAALEDQFNKIANVLNYCQKVIRNISNTEQRTFSLKLEQIKNKIIYVDFDPKGIKYSFDVDNVINAFVGENLYNDKLTSIRELLQNSIDTCRYKKVLNPNYVPEIKLFIENDFIRIEDNGLGMDEFIIKNYFGKLCSSFYQQESVKKDYDAIGQFGVGVFSYFLMADYIDIETKTEKSESLHFRLDKDPKNYFHFFKKANRKVAGTTITLNLKREYENYTTTNYIDYIKDKFRYIEFPISITSKNETFEVVKQEYETKNLKEKIINSLKHQHKKEANNIEIFTHNFKNESYEGSVAFCYLKDLSFEKVGYLLNKEIFESGRGIRNRNVINISQKGVLITNAFGNLDLPDTFYNINLIKKTDIQISRNGFSNNYKISKILRDIFFELTLNFFENLNSEHGSNRMSNITYNFICENEVDFEKNIYSKMFLTLNDTNNNYQYITYEDFFNRQLNRVVISLNKENTVFFNKKMKGEDIIEFHHDDKQSFYRMYKNLHILKTNNYVEILNKNQDYYFLELIRDYQPIELKNFINKDYYYFFIHTKKIDKLLIRLDENLNSYKNNPGSNYDIRINYNHEFIKEILSYEETTFNVKTIELIDEILSIIVNYYDYENYDDKFNLLKELEKELKNNIGLNYELKIEDII